MAVDDDGDDEAGGESGAIALAILLRGVEGLAKFGGVVGIEDRGAAVRAVPDFGGDGPKNRVFVAVSGDGRRSAGIVEFVGGGSAFARYCLI